MGAKIYLINSNKQELTGTAHLFEREGFLVESLSEVSEEGINRIYKNNPDLILLDLDLGNLDGIELCHKLKTENVLNAFIVLYTRHKENYIQIEAFKAGADDYIIRPICSRILMKKVKALLKRKTLSCCDNKAKIISYQQLKVDRESYLVYHCGREIQFPRKEFEMLYLLVSFPKKVFSREEIFQQVWKGKERENTRVIDVHIRKIRKKIGIGMITTVKGLGYQLGQGKT